MAADPAPQPTVPRRRRPARLPRVPGGRRNVVKVVLTDEEMLQINARARVAGVSVQRLFVEAALAGDAQTLSERRGLIAELTGARRLVAVIGRNVRGLAATVTATGEMPREASATLHAAARAIAQLDEVAGRLKDGAPQ